ncbi:MAG TPA: hypothetical protein VFL94_09710 [Actinomycetales bacterium]|nr:hypothetical protein [Actinomycetales bacterium]
MNDVLRSGLLALAERTPAARATDDEAARRAWRRRRLAAPPRVVAVALVCGLVALAVVVGLDALGRAPVVPAQGSGSLPARLVVPPVGTPLVTEQPIERAAYVIATGGLRRGTFSRGIAPVAVSADGGAYRVVPWHDGDHGIALSPDGRRLAWVVGDTPRVVTKTVVLTLASGELLEVPDAPTAAEGTAWSDDGSRLLVWGATRISENTAQGGRVEVRDATTLRLLSEDATHPGPAAMVGGRLLVPHQESGTRQTVVWLDRAVVSPDGQRAAQVVMPIIDGTAAGELVVHPVGRAVDSFTPVLRLRAAYAEALAWTRDGIVVATYAGARLRAPAGVEVLDPSTAAVVRTLTSLPADADPDLVVDVDPQVLAVAAGVLASGQVTDSRPRTWPWYSAERVRWWVSDPLAAGLQVGLALLALLGVLGVVHLARRARFA